MRIPNADNSIIESSKIVDYLLNMNHRRGGGKAKLLVSIGYDSGRWIELADDLRSQHLTAKFVDSHDSPWGTRYDIVAPLCGPSGDTIMFRSVWQIDLGSDMPRLIPIYPE